MSMQKQITKAMAGLLLAAGLFCTAIPVHGAAVAETGEAAAQTEQQVEAAEAAAQTGEASGTEALLPLDQFAVSADTDTALSPELSSGGDGLHFSLSTAGMKEGQYPVSVFENCSLDLGAYNGMRLEISNSRPEDLKLNLLVSSADGTVRIVQDGKELALSQENTWIQEKTELGCFTVPGSFEGSVYIPFSAFEKEDSDPSPGVIYGIGFTFVLPQDAQADVTVAAIQMLTAGEMQERSWFGIDGDESVLKPTFGESVASYQVHFYDLNNDPLPEEDIVWHISLDGEENPAGVQFDPDGLLTVYPEAAEGTYLLRASTDAGEDTVRQITFKASWTTTQKTDNGYDASMVPTDDVTQIVAADSVWMNDTFLWVLRIAACTAAAAFLLFYSYRHRKCRQQFIEEYKKGEH